ncbi:MAG: TadE/TadG family type IV pilus assembly protein [Pseudomonadota bacterium]
MYKSLKTRLLQCTTGFVEDTRGNIAMMSGVIALPFMTMLALAVDVNYASNHRHTVQASLDSALLAAARAGIEGNASQADMEAELSLYFQALVGANGGSVSCGAPTIDPTLPSGVVRASVSCYSETIMAGLIGQEQIDYDLDAEVNFGIGKIDVAFVFDVSGSMDDPVSDTGTVNTCSNGATNCTPEVAQSRMEALQTAATAGVSQLLAVNSEDTDDVRIAMVSYNQAVNAGVYFESVSGLLPERTYTFGDPDSGSTGNEGEVVVVAEGTAHKHMYAALFDTRDNTFVTELKDNTVLEIPEELAEHLTISTYIKSSSNKYGQEESMQLRLKTNSGFEYYRTENVSPYTLNGDFNGNYYSGQAIPTDEWAALRMRAYQGDNLTGKLVLQKTFDFRLDIVEEVDEEVPSITIEDTCTYERNNSVTWNTTQAPGPGQYLTADEATYDEDSQSWTVPAGCSSATPLALTGDQQVLNDYISALPTGGGTAGHLGMAWGRYLIAPEWSSVWPVTSTPLNYNEPDARKIIIMMTDGQFNRTYHSNLGTSFDQAKSHCDQAKTQGIIIYTISFDAPADAQAALDYCSSGVDYAFDVNNGQELLDAYTAIANRISDLRVSS